MFAKETVPQKVLQHV